mmetsp:Transcript_112609/g.313067  ORF Transcript_112609/g.313067 Transcript_112609/m.313067 type:complete len:217 (+) Transcript_112609:476-1126(+)
MPQRTSRSWTLKALVDLPCTKAGWANSFFILASKLLTMLAGTRKSSHIKEKSSLFMFGSKRNQFKSWMYFVRHFVNVSNRDDISLATDSSIEGMCNLNGSTGLATSFMTCCIVLRIRSQLVCAPLMMHSKSVSWIMGSFFSSSSPSFLTHARETVSRSGIKSSTNSFKTSGRSRCKHSKMNLAKVTSPLPLTFKQASKVSGMWKPSACPLVVPAFR